MTIHVSPKHNECDIIHGATTRPAQKPLDVGRTAVLGMPVQLLEQVSHYRTGCEYHFQSLQQTIYVKFVASGKQWEGEREISFVTREVQLTVHENAR